MTDDELNSLTVELTSSPVQFDAHCDFPASADLVFNIIADFKNLPQWMPFIHRVEVDNSAASQPGETGSVRIIYPRFGRPTLETVTVFRRPEVIAYCADDESLRGMFRAHTGILSLRVIDQKTTRLTWRTCAEPGTARIPRAIGRRLFPWIVNRSIHNLKHQIRMAANP